LNGSDSSIGRMQCFDWHPWGRAHAKAEVMM
jgi:hypothetical protein